MNKQEFDQHIEMLQDEAIAFKGQTITEEEAAAWQNVHAKLTELRGFIDPLQNPALPLEEQVALNDTTPEPAPVTDTPAADTPVDVPTETTPPVTDTVLPDANVAAPLADASTTTTDQPSTTTDTPTTDGSVSPS